MEEVGVLGYDLDSQAFSPSTADVERFECGFRSIVITGIGPS